MTCTNYLRQCFCLLGVLAFLFPETPAAAQRKRPARPARPARQTAVQPPSELETLRDSYIKATKEYKASLEKLLALYQASEARAEQRLAQLQRACAGPCEEQADLRREIDRFKANGNRYFAEAR